MVDMAECKGMRRAVAGDRQCADCGGTAGTKAHRAAREADQGGAVPAEAEAPTEVTPDTAGTAGSCGNPDHEPGVIGCPADVLDCNGIPADAADIASQPHAARIQLLMMGAESGCMVIGRRIVHEFGQRHTVGPVPMLADSDPYGRHQVRAFTVWSLVADGHPVTIVRYDGRTSTLLPVSSYVAVLAGGEVVAGKLNAAATPDEYAWRTAREFRCWLSDRAALRDSADSDQGPRDVTITHSADAGTVITGLSSAAGERAGLGSQDPTIMNRNEWHFVSGAAVWILPLSVGRRPATHLIDRARAGIERQGHNVTVNVTDHDIVVTGNPETPAPVPATRNGDPGGSGDTAVSWRGGPTGWFVCTGCQSRKLDPNGSAQSSDGQMLCRDCNGERIARHWDGRPSGVYGVAVNGEFAGAVRHTQAEAHAFEPNGADRTHCGVSHGSAKCGRLESAPIHAAGGIRSGEGSPDPSGPDSLPEVPETDSSSDVPVSGADVPATDSGEEKIMHAVFVRTDLVAALTYVNKGVPSRPAVPMAAAVILTVGAGHVEAHTVDWASWDASRSARIAASDTVAGTVAVGAVSLLKAVKGFKGKTVTLSVSGTDVTVTDGAATATLGTMPVEDYPEWKSADAHVIGTVQLGTLAALAGRVTVAAGIDETLPALTCVRVRTDRDHIDLTATDRYRLHAAAGTWSPVTDDDGYLVAPASEYTVPARILSDALAVMVKRAGKSPATVTVTAGFVSLFGGSPKPMWGIECNGVRLTVAACEGFPNVDRLWPAESLGTVTVRAGALADLVKTVSEGASRKPGTPVVVQLHDGQLTAQHGTTDDNRPARTGTIGGATVAGAVPAYFVANPGYLVDTVNAVAGADDTVTLAFRDAAGTVSAVKPIVATGEAAPGARALLMVIRSTLTPAEVLARQAGAPAAVRAVKAPAAPVEGDDQGAPETAVNGDQSATVAPVTADGDYIYVTSGPNGTELRCKIHTGWSADADYTVMDEAFRIADTHRAELHGDHDATVADAAVDGDVIARAARRREVVTQASRQLRAGSHVIDNRGGVTTVNRAHTLKGITGWLINNGGYPNFASADSVHAAVVGANVCDHPYPHGCGMAHTDPGTLAKLPRFADMAGSGQGAPAEEAPVREALPFTLPAPLVATYSALTDAGNTAGYKVVTHWVPAGQAQTEKGEWTKDDAVSLQIGTPDNWNTPYQKGKSHVVVSWDSWTDRVRVQPGASLHTIDQVTRYLAGYRDAVANATFGSDGLERAYREVTGLNPYAESLPRRPFSALPVESVDQGAGDQVDAVPAPADFTPYADEIGGCGCTLCRALVAGNAVDQVDTVPARALLASLADGSHVRTVPAEVPAEVPAGDQFADMVRAAIAGATWSFGTGYIGGGKGRRGTRFNGPIMHPALPDRRLSRDEWTALAETVHALGGGRWMSDVKGFACQSADCGTPWTRATRSTRDRVAEYLAETAAEVSAEVPARAVPTGDQGDQETAVTVPTEVPAEVSAPSVCTWLADCEAPAIGHRVGEVTPGRTMRLTVCAEHAGPDQVPAEVPASTGDRGDESPADPGATVVLTYAEIPAPAESPTVADASGFVTTYGAHVQRVHVTGLGELDGYRFHLVAGVGGRQFRKPVGSALLAAGFRQFAVTTPTGTHAVNVALRPGESVADWSPALAIVAGVLGGNIAGDECDCDRAYALAE